MSRAEHEHTINGVKGRKFRTLTWKESHRDLPTFASQTWKASREYKERDRKFKLTVELNFDDNCRNGHNTFGATCDIREYNTDKARWEEYGGGADHESIARVFPELSPLLKWHLVSTDGPMHYVQNTLYHAGDRDCWGLRKGEVRQIRNGKTGELCWIRNGGPTEYRDGPTRPADAVTHEWQPLNRIGEGKERQLDYARSSAVWPEATDAELTADDLKERLEARLPQLRVDFRAAMESCGFEY